MKYRNEFKYIITNNDLVVINNRLKCFLKFDSMTQNKLYNIRSIYFDSLDNKCFHENEKGISDRFKIRIRMYNRSTDDIKLEIKYKKNGCSKKDFCLINEELCKKIIKGKRLEYEECTCKPLRKLFFEQRCHCLMPKIIVEYDRVAFVDPIGNTRITLDTNIRASKKLDRFFESNIYSKPILENNKHILEVKFDYMLPSYIKNELEKYNFERVSLSKYYLSRLVFKEEVL